ncbi:hypothetical protein, partial [Streptomyces sp. SID486]|uniref:hypothetical protein n=1 Tax=Streptomyces sp. SID486 TaxID=2690264 RepID=UPI001F1CFB5A
MSGQGSRPTADTPGSGLPPRCGLAAEPLDRGARHEPGAGVAGEPGVEPWDRGARFEPGVGVAGEPGV